MIADVDDDGSGEIDFDEFKLMMKKQMRGSQITGRKQLDQVCKVLRLNNEGGVDLTTFERACNQIGIDMDADEGMGVFISDFGFRCNSMNPQTVSSVFSAINVSGTGLITQRELRKFLKAKRL